VTVEEAYAHYQESNYSNYRMLNDIQALESLLSVHLRPHFLAITSEDNVINIVISHPSFVFQYMHERVSKVFSLIKNHNSDILTRNIVVVQPFSADEMNDLFEYWV